MSRHLQVYAAVSNVWQNHAKVEELVRLWKDKKNLENIKHTKKDEENCYPENFLNVKSPREFIETLEDWIESHYGVKNIPLTYLLAVVGGVASPLSMVLTVVPCFAINSLGLPGLGSLSIHAG